LPTCIRRVTVQLKFLTDGVLRMQVGTNGTKLNGRMNLMEAALVVERLQARAAHAGEVEALKIARDALLTIVGEGYTTLADRLGEGQTETQRPEAG
jgi:hypothetical protein